MWLWQKLVQCLYSDVDRNASAAGAVAKARPQQQSDAKTGPGSVLGAALLDLVSAAGASHWCQATCLEIDNSYAF